jgi:hypothetical protein
MSDFGGTHIAFYVDDMDAALGAPRIQGGPGPSAARRTVSAGAGISRRSPIS